MYRKYLCFLNLDDIILNWFFDYEFVNILVCVRTFTLLYESRFELHKTCQPHIPAVR